MKSKTFVMMFLAIGCGLIAAYLTARISARQAAPDTLPVLVAKDKILAGQVIKDPEKLFVLMAYPTGSTPNAISNMDDLKNKIVNKSVQVGQWLTPDDISGNFGIEAAEGVLRHVREGGCQQRRGRVHPAEVAGERGRHHSQQRDGRQTKGHDHPPGHPRSGGGPERDPAGRQVGVRSNEHSPVGRQAGRLAEAGPRPEHGRLEIGPAGPRRRQAGAAPRAGVQLAGHADQRRLAVDAARPEKPLVKLAVAKEDLEGGTTIDDPKRFFDIKSFAEAPAEAVTEATLAGFKGKAIKHTLFKDGVLTSKHFKGEEFTPVVAKPVEPKHLLFIQNGGAARVFEFGKDGNLVVETYDDPAKGKEKKLGMRPGEPVGEEK